MNTTIIEPTAIGTAFEGGFYGGKIRIGIQDYYDVKGNEGRCRFVRLIQLNA